MRAIERLKRDHRLLRLKLDALSAALTLGPDTWFLLREICFTLSRQLQNHIRREEELFAACSEVVGEDLRARLTAEHRDEPALLRRVNRVFQEGGVEDLDRVKDVLAGWIDGLRRHIAEEEAEMFPVLERMLAAREPEGLEASSACSVDEATTANAVVRNYPQARAFFEALFINLAFEGTDCLDEIAWRRGFDTPEFLARLRQALEGTPSSEVDPVVC